MAVKRVGILGIPLIALVVGVVVVTWISLGSGVSSRATSVFNPPFQNQLTVEVARPINRLDSAPASGSVYNHVVAYRSSGQPIHLRASTQPLLFVAYWCPHCQRTLVLLNQQQASLKKKPIIVAMGYAAGTSLSEAVHLERQEELAFRLHGFQFVYLLDSDAAKYVPETYPTLVFEQRPGHLETIHSEHTLAVWKRALQ